MICRVCYTFDMEEGRLSNHEITKRRVRAGIADYDVPKAIRQFGLVSDEQFLYMDFMTRHYRINRKDGMTEWLTTDISDAKAATWIEAGFNETLTIFDILFYSQEDAVMSGTYTQIQNLSRVQTGSVYAGKGAFREREIFLDSHTDAFASACEALGGTPAGKGDVSYHIPVFQQIDMLVQFWCSDEDFPASLQFLYDENLLQFMHYETTWYVSNHFMELIDLIMKQ